MKSNIAISVKGISKKYTIQSIDQNATLRDAIVSLPKKIKAKKTKAEDFWALKDISFEVKKGEVLGIIGKNGAGKSTLLKILSRITSPTEGEIVLNGRVASLLEVGTGFNPELTGRENIYLNGSIIGMTRNEIKERFNDIVAFSGIKKFLDVPVKRYSSGMYVRLAFAVAAHLESEILLIDEVLAVGDAEFQKKCLGKMSSLAKSGRTVIFISHNMNAISKLCNHVIYLSKGEIIEYGSTDKVLSNYFDSYSAKTRLVNIPGFDKSGVKILDIDIFNKNGQSTTKLIRHDKELIINLKYNIYKPIKALLSLMFFDEGGSFYLLTSEKDCPNKPQNIRKYLPGTYSVQVVIPSHTFTSGNYNLIAQIDNPFQKTYFKTNEIGFVVDQNIEPLNNLWAGKIKLKTNVLAKYTFKKI